MSDLEMVLEALDRLRPDEIEQVKRRLEQPPKPESEIVYPRIPGLHRGLVWMSEDFNDPLPDEFWFGEEE